MDVYIEYQDWFWPLLLLCLLCGAVYASVLYALKDSLLEEVRKGWKAVMWFFRFAAVALLAFFLLGPHLNAVERETEKPVVVIAQDNSESLLTAQDSDYYYNTYQPEVDALTQRLSEKYDVKTYLFGDHVRPDRELTLGDKQTDISEVFDEVATRYSNRNLGAIILAGDGIYTSGTSPLYAAKNVKVPIYTIALGDTTVKKDLLISNVAHNRLAYLGNDFPLEVVVEARRLGGQSSRLRVSNGDGVLFEQTVDIDKDNFLTVVPVKLEATKTGLQRFRVSLSVLDGEVSEVNNTTDVFIDVLDSRQKILILANAPHPDIAALKTAIRSNKNYEVDAKLFDDHTGTLDAYSLVILHQLPSIRTGVDGLLEEIRRKKIPVLTVLGAHTRYATLGAQDFGVSLTGYRNRLNASGAHYNGSFSLFNLDPALQRQIEEFPPLHTGFGTWRTSNGVTPLFRQRIGNVRTEDPLFVFGKRNGVKYGVIAGEGIWRWKLYDFSRNRSHNLFNDLITKSVQYLAAKEDKSYFRVYCDNAFKENEIVDFAAELYNQSYELINESDVSLTVRNSEGKEFPFAFSKAGNAYRLEAGQLPVGEYTYVATTSHDGTNYEERGEFSVSAVQVELSNSTADHRLLFQLADNSEGIMVYPGSLNSIADKIDARDEITPIYYTTNRTTDLINWKWICVLILALLTLEWFSRKRNGAY